MESKLVHGSGIRLTFVLGGGLEGPPRPAITGRTRSHPPPQSASEGIGGARGLGNLVRGTRIINLEGLNKHTYALVSGCHGTLILWHTLLGYRRPVGWCEQPDRPGHTGTRVGPDGAIGRLVSL